MDTSVHPLKRGANDQSNKDAPLPKRRNTGNMFDLRRTRSRNAVVNSTGGTLTDPLNLNNTTQDIPANFIDRKRRFEEAPGVIYQRRISFRHPKKRVEHVPATPDEPQSTIEARKARQKKMIERYRYGNFNYHHKTNNLFQNDPRLDLMVEDWFRDKNVLDIGCNAGTLTLSIARTFSPRRILGIDIDPHLIGIGRKNIRHFQDRDLKIIGRFPASFALNYGPVTVPSTSTNQNFPDNVWFRQENYVLANDEALENEHEQYDTILAFGVTKWIALNFGDDGLKRVFKRVFKQLKPGGRFVFEPQSKRKYGKRTMIPEIEQNYKSLKFWPKHYINFLMSIGFCHYEALETPLVSMLDCDAPILMFYKGPLTGWKDTFSQSTMSNDTGEHSYHQQSSFATPRADSQYASTPREDPQSTPEYA